ncbi:MULTISPECIES: tryptophan 2-C-methyltransferase [Amycolatopsis]|uniref:Tryptophan 2-C-methyltransferase n=1 Tax=Amycolatopsis tucumanensis TaxID=401106 RepID=A0ABP7JFA0_9PSEU|nr:MULTISPECIES: tryptophan 2-C-methyltransferase [Amycolatopsis]MCF6427282.1 tryptophan 2-C-methyltransferase [Amycolatopsis tucumanensis]
MSKGLITLVNPNLVHPPITPYALDILTTSLEDAGFDVEVLDLTFSRTNWTEVVDEYFGRRQPMLIGVTIRNTDTIYPQEQRVFLGSHKEIIDRVRARTGSPVVAGGVGFSSMPYALVDYLGIDYGVKGPGEVTLVQLAEALAGGRRPETVPGLIVNHGAAGVHRVPHPDPVVAAGRVPLVQRVTPYRRHSGRPDRVDNLTYFRRGGLGNILTKNGCAFACTHCVEPDAKGNRFARRTETAVVDEMETLLAQGIHDLHTTDSEFNLNIAHSKAVLREIVRRRSRDSSSPLHDLRLWVYVQPAPFDAEYAALLAEAGCAGINVAPDHSRPELLDGWKVSSGGTRFYTFEDVRNVCRWASEHGIATMVEALLGMPGETPETMLACVDDFQSLDATVVGYTLGIRVFPYSPLGRELAAASGGEVAVPGLQSNDAEEPIVLTPLGDSADTVSYERQFMFDRQGRFRPVYYFSPHLLGEDERGPGQRYDHALALLWERVPQRDRLRVMLPTRPGLSPEDNNYADNPFLLRLTELGYTGAYWSHWPKRYEIMEGVPA